MPLRKIFGAFKRKKKGNGENEVSKG